MIEAILKYLAPELIAQTAIGLNSAAQLLLTAGDNPDRLKSEASFAAFCGVRPVSDSPGKTARTGRTEVAVARPTAPSTFRHRASSIGCSPQDYVARRIAAGNSKREAIRCLKQYVAREVYGVIMRGHVRGITCSMSRSGTVWEFKTVCAADPAIRWIN